MISNYLFKTKPLDHQLDQFLKTRDLMTHAAFWEQGTGKTKFLIDSACYQYTQGNINGVLVFCPNNVNMNWLVDELPAHHPEYIPYHAALWLSSPRVAQKKALEELFNPGKLHWLIVNYEAMKKGSKAHKLIMQFVRTHKVFAICDESHRFKNPSAKTTKALQTLSKLIDYKRIATGTSITEGPMDLFSQMRWLADIWPQQTFTEYKSYYAETITRVNKAASRKLKREVTYEEITSYKNIAEMERRVSRHCSHILKEECLDLPEKVYKKAYVELSPEQRRLYNEMREHAVTKVGNKAPEGLTPDEILLWLLTDEVGKVVAVNGGVKQLRLQQILGGYLPDENGRSVSIDEKNPRIKVLLNTIEDIPGKIVIFARFRAELAAISAELRRLYGQDSVVEYHGGVTDPIIRAQYKAQFQDKNSPVRFFVAQQRSGATGLTLTASSNIIYFSNEFSYGLRSQSEDRIHRIGQINHATYTDIQARGTVDMRIMKELTRKHQVAKSFNYERK